MNGCFNYHLLGLNTKKLEKHVSWMDYLKLCFNGCSVSSNHFPLVKIWFIIQLIANHFKNWLALEFQVVIFYYIHTAHKYIYIYIYIYVPGDAKGACLSPIVTVGGHDSPLKGSLFHQPKKSHQQNCQVYKHTHGIHVWLYLPTFTIKINQMWVKHIIHGSYGIWIPIF